jgi:hypothetical protein
MPGCSRTMGVAGSLLLSLIVGDSAIANAATDRLERDAALPFLVAQAGGLHGTEPSDERNRSGPNGYVQAPIPRDEAPSGPSATETRGNTNRSTLPTRGVPETGKALSPGQDPGTAMPTPNTGKTVNTPP